MRSNRLLSNGFLKLLFNHYAKLLWTLFLNTFCRIIQTVVEYAFEFIFVILQLRTNALWALQSISVFPIERADFTIVIHSSYQETDYV